MKKVYEAPAVEKIAFQYRDQVVVASGLSLGTGTLYNTDGDGCDYTQEDYNASSIQGFGSLCGK